MALPSASAKEDSAIYDDHFDREHATSLGSEYESDPEIIDRDPNPRQTVDQPRQLQVNRRLKKFRQPNQQNDENQLTALQPLDRGESEQYSLSGPVSRMDDQSTEEIIRGTKEESQQIQQKDEDTGLKLRLDLNLDVEVELKAKIHGDITLSLL
ncbi:hypothetical protein BDV59DRAFT_205255 [Aspergillus ambiguus]|uniref:uncharacterized protein n=1 Tax=Aspergillus ambiguus TaxID=176160 RepID=UPI003CCE3E00